MLRARPAFFFIQFLDLEEQPANDLLIAQGLAGRIKRRLFPLQPARGVDEGAVFFGKARGRQQEHFGLNPGRVTGAIVVFLRQLFGAPEGGRLGLEILSHDHPLELGKRGDHLGRVGPVGHRIHAERDQPVHAALVHLVEEVAPPVILGFAGLGEPIIAEAVLARGLVAVVSLEQAHREFRRVAPVIQRVGPQRLRRVGLQILVKRGVIGARDFEIPGQIVPGAHVGGALNIGVATLRVDAAAGHADVTHE